MLFRLGADDPRFKTVSFREGMNLLVARRMPEASETDTRNGVGKSSLIEILHFLLGANVERGHIFRDQQVKDIRFSLNFSWPESEERVVVSRSGSSSSVVDVSPPIASSDGLFDAPTSQLPIAAWNTEIESRMFSLTQKYTGVSGRSMLSFLMRRTRTHSFNDPVKSIPLQPEATAIANLAYMLGLDVSLASRFQELNEREKMGRQIGKIAADPALGRVIGRIPELQGEIAARNLRIAELRRQISEFRVVPRYEELRKKADELHQKIRDLRDQDTSDKRNLEFLERAVQEVVDPEVQYLQQVYEELGVQLTEQVYKRFDEVRQFHDAIVMNRRTYLDQQIEELRSRIRAREGARIRLGEEQSRILRTLDEGGALEGLTVLQQTLGEQEAALNSLNYRLEAAVALENSKRATAAARIELSQAVSLDLQERRQIIHQCSAYFNRLVTELYGEGRHSHLIPTIENNRLKIDLKIDGDPSTGIKHMAIFCFDLTLAVMARRRGRGPDFLVHDSHIFDGVDDRQLSRALSIAARVAEQEQIQYIATINEDDLDKARRTGLVADQFVIDPYLTDEFEEGGLFGFRFGSLRDQNP
jgi:uncharacterized protein YydD (DUF2326 family)